MPLQTTLNSFAVGIFRKQADFDYISARSNYKLQFRQQFIWAAQQAIEKYLKAILLFNGKSAKSYPDENGKKHKYGHDLCALCAAVKQIDYLRFQLLPENESFLKYLNEQGSNNRYLSTSSYNRGDAIQMLDSLVWHLRRYCQFIPNSDTNLEPNVSRVQKALLDFICSFPEHNYPHKFRLQGGELEKILQAPATNSARKTLVWANLWYGIKRRKRVTYSPFSSTEIPPNERHWFNENMKRQLADYIKF